jgi:Gpi18-like mannosyltransferase
MIAGDLGVTLALGWIIGCTAVFFYLLKCEKMLPDRGLVLIGVAFLVRLVPALILPNGAGYEMQVFREAADIFWRGESIYLVRVAHPYLPFIIYWHVLADWLAENVGLYFVFWVKSLNLIVDSLIALIIFVGLSRYRAREIARKTAWLYVFNPITILVAVYQGQFDALPLFFVVLALVFLRA